MRYSLSIPLTWCCLFHMYAKVLQGFVMYHQTAFPMSSIVFFFSAMNKCSIIPKGVCTAINWVKHCTTCMPYSYQIPSHFMPHTLIASHKGVCYTVFICTKEIMFFGSIGIFVCLSVSNITTNGMIWLKWNFMEGYGVVIGTSDKCWWWSGSAYCLSTRTSGHYSANYVQILMKHSGEHCRDIKNNFLNFRGDLDHHADSPNRESAQCGGNELPWWRSAFSGALFFFFADRQMTVDDGFFILILTNTVVSIKGASS